MAKRGRRKVGAGSDKSNPYRMAGDQDFTPFERDEEIPLPEDDPEFPPHVVHPSPSNDPVFSEVWDANIGFLAKHPKFHKGLLLLLREFCNLHIEREQLDQFVKANGYTYETVSDKGIVSFAKYPQVDLLHKVRYEIIQMAKTLQLHVHKATRREDINKIKDSEQSAESKKSLEAEDEWS